MEANTAGKGRIMVIEDDVNLNKLIAYNLSKNGYLVDSAYDGISAKEKISQQMFDVVVLDIMLPGMDGFRLCEVIKGAPKTRETFVVVLTARAEPLDKIYGNMLGADRYLTKPFSVAGLINIIQELIEGRGNGACAGIGGQRDNIHVQEKHKRKQECF